MAGVLFVNVRGVASYHAGAGHHYCARAEQIGVSPTILRRGACPHRICRDRLQIEPATTSSPT